MLLLKLLGEYNIAGVTFATGWTYHSIVLLEKMVICTVEI